MKVLVFGSKGLVGSSVSKKITEVEPSYKLVKSSREDTNLFSYIETSKKICHSSHEEAVGSKPY